MMSEVLLAEKACCSHSRCPPPNELMLLAQCPVYPGTADNKKKKNSTCHSLGFCHLGTPQGQGVIDEDSISRTWRGAWIPKVGSQEVFAEFS